MMKNTNYLLLLLLGTAIFSGCATQKHSLYQWGSYEDQVYAMYNDPGKVSVEQQVINLEKDYQVARSTNKSVPPGYHAHLGYLYFQLGKRDQALQSFVTEKTLFPESTIYMDRLIKRIKS